jgi:hypothetical protein
VRGQLIRVARREIASLYGLDSITDDDERRHTLEHLLDNNAYMLRAVDRSLPVDVRYLLINRKTTSHLRYQTKIPHV